MGELQRMTQFKDKNRGAGAPAPWAGSSRTCVLMAADILLYDADVCR